MPILLYRVDERLIHGQVVVGWGSELRPDRYLVVDEDLARSEWEQELYLLGLPDGVTARFVSVDEARERLDEWRASADRSVLLTRDVETMLKLARGGVLSGERVNLGGIHHGPERSRVLSYLHLDAEDRDRLRKLRDEGVEVTARDLPGSPGVSLSSLLKGDGGR
ncbi:MAG: PTS transporter subunit IIB [Gemmatimonadetes bacterium]|nr:PTS sugar transporter subunit IIB [Gemmatimonadota bacterium]NIR80011.1 PTS sugar transporter subunit IIB [Gemmatimonadota bacterium]NIT85479.1 PTS sugar transporter subunit IIB [Gemmatimonadota bacterium]NIU29303.1 PTS sugar transporter subunit IIB [Gemmatimonadota bacterium]NIU34380.1 PTS transporter subunit IIB [Gemmatimonadota bacterium]